MASQVQVWYSTDFAKSTLRGLVLDQTAAEVVEGIKYRKVADLLLPDARPESLLDDIFMKMNRTEGSELCDLLGERSMSVGDIVVIDDDNVYLCVTIGWCVLTEFEKEEAVESNIRVPPDGQPDAGEP